MTLGILLVDDNEPYRAGVRAILEYEPGIEVGGAMRPLRLLEAGTAEEGLRKVESQQPDIVLVDLRLPDRLGIPSAKIGLDFIKRVCSCWSNTKTVVLTVCDNDGHIDEALRAGARGYLVKDADDHRGQLLHMLREVANGHVVLGKAGEALSKILAREATPYPTPFDRLHPVRDRKLLDIVDRIAEGLEYREIARQMQIPPATVNNRISEIVKRLDLASRNILYFWAGRVLGPDRFR